MTEFVGILGKDFCGSTIMSRVLNAVDGVASIGEVFWVVDAPEDRGRCTLHGEGCPYIDPARTDPTTNDKNLYARLAEQFDASHLVVSDKHFYYYDRFIPTGNLHAIVMFKNPMAFLASDVRNIQKYSTWTLGTWRNNYNVILRRLGELKSWVVVDLDLFAREPGAQIRRVCRSIGVDPVIAGNLFVPFCNVGGNGHARGSEKIFVDDRWITELPMAEKVTMMGAKDVWETYFRLLELSRCE